MKRKLMIGAFITSRITQSKRRNKLDDELIKTRSLLTGRKKKEN